MSRITTLDFGGLILSAHKDPHAQDNREILRRYKNQRLAFEGVLIAVRQPINPREEYRLIFGSVAAIHEPVELDHVVIHTPHNPYQPPRTLGVGKRFRFKATVASYKKVQDLLYQPAQVENFELTCVDLKRIEHADASHLAQPTQFVKNRAESIALRDACPFSADELIDMALTYPNDGAIEYYFEEWRQFTNPTFEPDDVAKSLVESFATDSRRRRG